MSLESAALSVAASDEVYSRVTVTTAEAQRIQTSWHKSWITFCAEGVDVGIKWTVGTSAVAADLAATSSMGSGVTANDASPATGGTIPIPAGTCMEFDLRNFTIDGVNRLFFSHKSAATTGKLKWWRSSGPGA